MSVGLPSVTKTNWLAGLLSLLVGAFASWFVGWILKITIGSFLPLWLVYLVWIFFAIAFYGMLVALLRGQQQIIAWFGELGVCFVLVIGFLVDLMAGKLSIGF